MQLLCYIFFNPEKELAIVQSSHDYRYLIPLIHLQPSTTEDGPAWKAPGPSIRRALLQWLGLSSLLMNNACMVMGTSSVSLHPRLPMPRQLNVDMDIGMPVISIYTYIYISIYLSIYLHMYIMQYLKSYHIISYCNFLYCIIYIDNILFYYIILSYVKINYYILLYSVIYNILYIILYQSTFCCIKT